jgi:hypothetical protein
MLEGAARYAAAARAPAIEEFPVVTRKKMAPPFVWTGTDRAFAAAGYVEIAKRSAARKVFRRMLEDG